MIAVLLYTCTSEVYNPNVCFQENVLPIFVSKCSMTGCHNSADHKADYDLINYDGIMKGIVAKYPLQSELYKVIQGSNPSMPPLNYPQLSKLEIDYIKIWIKMGAQNSSNCSSCDTTSNFSGRIKPLVDSWCLGCHNAGNAGGGYDFSNYAGIVVAITDGRFSGTIQHLSGFSPMPKNTNALNTCDINALQSWINAGYPNN